MFYNIFIWRGVLGVAHRARPSITVLYTLFLIFITENINSYSILNTLARS